MLEIADANAQRYVATGDAEKRLDRSTIFRLALACVLILVSIGSKAYRLTFPTDGWSATTDFADLNPIFSQNLLGLPSPLQGGDKLLAVDGHPFTELVNQALRGQALRLDGYGAGHTLRYTILRAGKTLDLEVPLAAWTAAGRGQAVWQLVRGTPYVGERTIQIGGLASWLMMLLTAFLLWQRPRHLPAQLLFLALSLFLVGQISWIVAPFAVADAMQPTTAWLARVGYFWNPLCIFPLQLHFLLIFPAPKPMLQRFPVTLAIIYSVPWLVLGLTSLLTNHNAPLFLLIPLYQVASLITALYSLVTEKEPTHQAQMRWLLLGMSLWSLSLILYTLSARSLLPGIVANVLGWLPRDLLLTICLVIAVLRYRLFDINVILSRALVYGGLTAAVIGVYALVVGGIGSLVQAQGNVLLSLFATGLIAVAFHPLRLYLQSLVNRLLYGERTEPYQVLRKLSGQMEGPLEPAQLLPTITATMVETLKLAYAAIVLGAKEEGQIVAAHGIAGSERLTLPLIYQGETIGELWLDPRPGESFQPPELNLLKTIAQQASVAAYTVKQNLDLQRSRTRLVSAREEERRRIRRDLHDGLGPILAALAMQADTAQVLIESDPQAARQLMATVTEQAKDVVQEVRRLVYDLRPPSLDEIGLVGAVERLAQQHGSATLRIEVRSPAVLPPLPAAVEVAIYRIAAEALTNVVRHAQATHCLVQLGLVQLATGDAITLITEDNGVGIREQPLVGIGLTSMRERASEVNGTLVIAPQASGGTRLVVCVPLAGKGQNHE